MKIRLTLTLAALAFLALATSWRPADAAGQDKGESALAGYMGELNGTLRKQKDTLADPKTMGEALDDICRLQKVVIDAKNELPSTVTGIEDEKKRAKARVEYRLEMQELERALLDLEAAILTEDGKKAGKAMRELDKVKQAGHSQFKPKD